jgi:beta-phosphoglucomutase-like phosphatase (HAD superfamily)
MGVELMKLPVYIGLLVQSERTLGDAYRQVADAHGDEPDVHFLCLTLAGQCDDHITALQPMVARYGESAEDDEPERLHADALEEPRTGPLGLLRDLQDLYLLASLVDVTWTMLGQAAQALRDRESLEVIQSREKQTSTQLAWLRTRMKQAAPQALIVAS